MWDILVVQPVFNVIAFFVAIIPGHNLGIALVVLAVLVKLVFWPLYKKQMKQMRLQKELQPEVAKIKKMHKGNRQAEALAVMTLYREKGFKPMRMLFHMVAPFPILLALFHSLKNIVADPENILNLSYSFIRDLPWMQKLDQDITLFDQTFVGLVDLTRPTIETIESNGSSEVVFYAAAFVVLTTTAAIQFLVIKQSMKSVAAAAKPPRKIREIFKASKQGKEIDSQELFMAQSRLFIYVLPAIIFFAFAGLYAAVPFYYLCYNLIQFFQHRLLHNQLAPVEVSVDGRGGKGIVEKPLNAKQKKERRASAATRKRVAATARTVKRKKKT